MQHGIVILLKKKKRIVIPLHHAINHWEKKKG